MVWWYCDESDFGQWSIAYIINYRTIQNPKKLPEIYSQNSWKFYKITNQSIASPGMGGGL